MSTHAMLVKEFTEESKGIVVPDRPVPMSREAVRFLAKMMMSEIVEMLETHDNFADAYSLAHVLLDEDRSEKAALEHADRKYPLDPVVQITEQMDAMVDSYYYSLDSAAKHGMNLEPIFMRVHEANMRKRNPQTGLFERRSDGKVIKPAGWTEADINEAVMLQLKNGSWC